MAPPVFGRPSDGSHLYDPALDEWERCGVSSRAAIAWNIRYDHRVSKERERRFDEQCECPRSAGALEDGVRDYFKTWIRSREDPDYILEKINGQNIIVGGTENHRTLKGTMKLGRILDLNGLRHPCSLALQATEDECRADPQVERLKRRFGETVRALNNDDQFSQLLDDQLSRAGSKREEFLSDVLLALKFAATKAPFQPSWVALWSDLEPHLQDDNPERWAEALGIALHNAGRWLIVLRYTIEEAAMLVRPTQLDAGWCEYHFPSPEHLDAKSGGHPMDLGDPLPPAPLTREFIHSSISYNFRHWIDAGRRIKRTIRATSCDLAQRRRRHYQRLEISYPGKIGDWMPRP